MSMQRKIEVGEVIGVIVLAAFLLLILWAS